MKLTREEIINRIVDVLLKVKKSDKYQVEKFNLELTGCYFDFDECDMVYLTLELTNEFNVDFEESDFLNYNFNTINKIIDIICEKLGS